MPTRARDLGIRLGRLQPGRWNAITDIAGVRVGHTTIARGAGPLVVGQGPVRTGVTAILPRDGNVASDPVYAGSHVLNGYGEMTGLAWIAEAGLLTVPIMLTNTRGVGAVHEAVAGYGGVPGAQRPGPRWSLPVVAETSDHILNDSDGKHVQGALCAATTMVGKDGVTAHALPHDEVLTLITQRARPRPSR